MKRDLEGIKQIGRNLYAVRVKRLEARTGRQRNRRTTVEGTQADAIRERDRIRAELRSTVTLRPKIRLAEFVASWLEQRSGRLKPGTIRRYGYAAAKVIPVLGEIYVDALAPSDIADYISKRVKEQEGHTVRNELQMLRTMAKDSVAEGYAAIDWCARVAAPKVRVYTRQRPNLMTGVQFEILLSKIPPQWLGLVLFMATTGLRWGEASALRWQDIDWTNGEADIRFSNSRGNLTTTKNRSSERLVPVLPEVARLWGPRKTSGLVFPSRYGKLHKGSPLRKVLDKACAAAKLECPDLKIPRITSHGLRRTFNNEARKKTSREVLKSITGHVTDVMVGHYSMIAPDERRTASSAVARSIGIVSDEKAK